MGFVVIHAESGSARVEKLIEAGDANGHGIVHGGITFALADTAFAMAANSVADSVVTTDANISYLAPGQAGKKLVAEAKVRFHEGRRVLVDVIVSSEGKTIALYTGSGVSLRKPGA